MGIAADLSIIVLAGFIRGVIAQPPELRQFHEARAYNERLVSDAQRGMNSTAVLLMKSCGAAEPRT